MNQDTESLAYAKHGKILIPGLGDDEPAEYTPEAARNLISDLANAIREAAWQRRDIAAACANGHAWSSGYNSTIGDKTTVYHCTREGCDGRKEEPGWLPFEPKQHLVPYSPKLWDCTGPGCEHCDNESYADNMNTLLTGAYEALKAEFDNSPLGEQPDPRRLLPKIEVKKLGYVWSIDATPAEIQTALDARQELSKSDPEGHQNHA